MNTERKGKERKGKEKGKKEELQLIQQPIFLWMYAYFSLYKYIIQIYAA